MRKNATKLAAAVLSLAMVMTSVSVPASAAKTKKAKLNKTKATLYTNGSKSQKSTTLKLTVGGKKVKATFKSSNTKLLTVGKTTGKVTAKKNGTATVTATYKKKAYKCKITVKTYATSVSVKAKTLTLKEGKTATIKTTVKPSTASNKKVSFTSSNKSVATVSSKGKVTAKKAGTAKITVKALGAKKGVKAATVTVKVEKATPAPTETPLVTESPVPTETPSVATEGTISVTTNVSGASVKITNITSGSSVVINDTFKDKTYTTAKLAPGEYEVEVTKEGYDPYKTTVKVDGDVTVEANLKESIVTGATATVSNALVDYKDTVLVNDNAIVTVNVKDSEGNAVAGKTVVFSIEQIQSVTDSSPEKLEIKGEVVKTTDANGDARFIVGLKNATKDSTDTSKVASAKYTAKVLNVTDGTESSATGGVGFAALKLSTVENVTSSSTLVKGKNAEGKTDSVAKTYSLNENDTANVDYIATQQVSTEGKDEHKVTFKAVPQIVLPTMPTDDKKAKEFVQHIDYKSGEYFTYDEKTYPIILGEKADNLLYATLMFNDIKVSKYTSLVIESFTDEDCKYPIDGSKQTIVGEHSQKDFGYQIPVGSGVKAITVTVKSEGQVQTNMNSGYDIDKIVGVYKNSTTSAGYPKDIPSAKINWETAKPTMSNFEKLSDETRNKLGITTSETDHTFDYQVPVFPHTGDAVIREHDVNGKVVKYYLAPTVKSTSGNDKNTNVLAVDKASSSYTGIKAYEATEQEATSYEVGTFETNGTSLSVNSSKVGSTNLKGTISLPSLGEDAVDDSNKYVYTSVQWNPLPKDATKVNSEDFIALAGQNISVYAQLIDKNGNPVTKSDETVTYTYGDNNSSIANDAKNVEGAAIVKNEKTDKNGRATLILNGPQKMDICKLKATAPSGYDVVLCIGNETVSSADLHWIDANLQFVDRYDDKPATTTTTDNDTKDVKEDVEPSVANPWQYAVKTVGSTITTDCGLSGYTCTIDGLKINTTFDEDNRGEYKIVDNGKVNATSSREYKDRISNEINSSSVGKDVTFTFTKNGAETKKYTCVGEGTANLNAKLNLNIAWKASGASIAISSPSGTTISKATDNAVGTVDLYVKVTDETGKNPLPNKTVKFTPGTSTDQLQGYKADGTSNGSQGAAGAEVESVTDSNGIAKVKLTTAAQKQASSVITASYDKQVATSTINWVTNSNEFGLVNATLTDKKHIKLTFNNDVYANSVKVDMFELTNSAGKLFQVTDAAVSGRYVTLTLKNDLTVADDYKVTIDGAKDDGIPYSLCDSKGVKLTKKEVSFYSDMEAKFETTVADTANTGEATITICDIKTGGVNGEANDTTNALAKFKSAFVITVDGVIQKMDSTAGENQVGVAATGSGSKMGDYTYTITLKQTDKDQKVAIYYCGGVKTMTVGKFSQAYNDKKDVDKVYNDLIGKSGKKITDLFTSKPASIAKSALTGLATDGTTISLSVDTTNSVLTDGESISIDNSKSATDKITLTIKKGEQSKNITVSIEATGSDYNVSVSNI